MRETDFVVKSFGSEGMMTFWTLGWEGWVQCGLRGAAIASFSC